MRNPPRQGNPIPADVAASLAKSTILLIWVGDLTALTNGWGAFALLNQDAFPEPAGGYVAIRLARGLMV
ncbi:hypothetical protein JD507_04885 [Aeromonas jandaei]|uniref:hypothetical protein n=1 Tax=Aeromonas jandaei TaxID=650 RepID=UPI00191D937C|nr:hypothetical protein [Aeromonas jandaei]MBL0544558.1 hypothetical protein [Aeromonas jandaei]